MDFIFSSQFSHISYVFYITHFTRTFHDVLFYQVKLLAVYKSCLYTLFLTLDLHNISIILFPLILSYLVAPELAKLLITT